MLPIRWMAWESIVEVFFSVFEIFSCKTLLAHTHWHIGNVFLFSTEIWVEQLQKTTLYIILHHKRAFGSPFAIGPRDHGRLV